jgi:uncharacterized repeat protein (TIGR01451 family)
MMKRLALILILAACLAGGPSPALGQVGSPDPRTVSTIQAPLLKWQDGGCYSSWCETGWYASPAVADLDGDGQAEVIGSGYTIFVLNGATGDEEWHMPSGYDRSSPGVSSNRRTWPGIALADLFGDGRLEIVTAHSGGVVSVYDAQGYFMPGWPQHPTSSELRGLSLADLDGDGQIEIVVTAAIGSKTTTWVYQPDGSLRPGWPQLSNDSGYGWGVYNDNSALGDINGDGQVELVVPSDVHYINAYNANGVQLPANPIYGGKNWGQVGAWESPVIELRGWGTCTDGDPRAERYRANFADGPAAIGDLNGDGVNEVVVTGNMYDCISGYPSKYMAAFIFNGDRSRFNQNGFDWSVGPIDTGAPIQEDYNVIESAEPNPVLADLDGDGNLEILYASYDGRLHAFWLDKTEHGSWPYHAYTSGPYRFASEPAVADLNDDGKAEVIFTTWVQKGSGLTGQLVILDCLGNLLQAVDLPPGFGGVAWNGAMAAPTLANIDSDPDLEVVIETAHSGLVAYDLPGTANARILWGTGRGSYLRNGTTTADDLISSSAHASGLLVKAGDTIHYSFVLRNSGSSLSHVAATDTLPPGLSFAGDLQSSSGTATQDGGVVSWQGALLTSQEVSISFDATLDASLTGYHAIHNQMRIDSGAGQALTLQADVFVNAVPVFLPVLRR